MTGIETALPGQLHPATEIHAPSDGGRSHRIDPKSRDGLLRTIEYDMAHYLATDREFSVYVGDHAAADIDEVITESRSRYRGWTVIPIKSSGVPGVSNPTHLRVIVLRFKQK